VVATNSITSKRVAHTLQCRSTQCVGSQKVGLPPSSSLPCLSRPSILARAICPARLVMQHGVDDDRLGGRAGNTGCDRLVGCRVAG